MHCVLNFVSINSTVLHIVFAIIMSFSITFFKSFFVINGVWIDEKLMFIRFFCFVNHIELRSNLLEFHCSISFCSCCILFDALNASISMSCTIASCHFLIIFIFSNISISNPFLRDKIFNDSEHDMLFCTRKLYCFYQYIEFFYFNILLILF